MRRAIDKQEVRKWLSGQRAAGERLAQERVQFLVSLTYERSIEIYLGLCGVMAGDQRETPSPVLLAVRQAVLRLNGANGRWMSCKLPLK
jgi:hypothetical protein